MIWQRKKSLLCWFDPAASSQFHLLRSPCQRFGSPWFCLTQNLRAPLEQMLNDQFEIGCSFWFFPTCVPGSLLSCPGISRFLSKTGWTVMVFTMKRVPWNGAGYCFQITDNEARPKPQRSSCATSNNVQPRIESGIASKSFLLTFEWCRSQMMLISLKRNTAGCIVESRQVVQWAKYAASWPRNPFRVSRMQSEGWLRWRHLVTTSRPSFLLIIPTYYMLLLRLFQEHICTVNNGNFLWGARLFDN